MKADKTHWVEKTPWNSLVFPEIAELLPDAKLLHIVRDSRDVIDSIRRTLGPKDMVGACIRYEQWLKRWEDVQEETRRLPNYREVPYEHLTSPNVGRQRQTMTVLADFLGLPGLKQVELKPMNTGNWVNWDHKDIDCWASRLQHRVKAAGL